VTPERQYPGGSIVLSGVQFIPATQQRVRLEAVDDPSIVYDLTGTLQGFGKLRLTVAQKVVPGRYRIAIGGLPGGATAAVISNWKELEVRAPFYQMVYERIRCIDETDPEWPGDDEIVTLWAINADPNYTWIKQTGEYTDFSDGVSRDYDAIHRSVFNPEGHAQAVNRYLATATTLWEWDAGDASQAGEALSLAGDVVLGVGTAIGGWGAVVGVVADIVLDVVGALVVLFGGDPDFLGTHTAAWGAADLQLATAGTNSTAGTLTFTGSNGKYEVDYRVIRHQP
jgi:hypothetical protein